MNSGGLEDIRVEGRSWSPEEMQRHDDLPGRLDMWAGKLCRDESERLLLLGALLEHVGTARAVRLGPFQAWVDAVAQRQEDLGWDRMPAVGVEQFWRPATLRLSCRMRMELKATMKKRGPFEPRRSNRLSRQHQPACTSLSRRQRLRLAESRIRMGVGE